MERWSFYCGHHVTGEQQFNTVAEVLPFRRNDPNENVLMNSRNATISTIPIVITMCIKKKMPLDDSF
jgi:hypothetical protein